MYFKAKQNYLNKKILVCLLFLVFSRLSSQIRKMCSEYGSGRPLNTVWNQSWSADLDIATAIRTFMGLKKSIIQVKHTSSTCLRYCTSTRACCSRIPFSASLLSSSSHSLNNNNIYKKKYRLQLRNTDEQYLKEIDRPGAESC